MPAAITPSVLIINACVETMQATASILQASDYQVAAATNSNDAHQLAANLLLDLVLLDVSVIAAGRQLATIVASLHALPGRHDVPLLITSSRQRSSVIRRNQPWGATYHVQVPASPTVLLDLVDRSLQQTVRTKPAPQPSVVPAPHVLAPNATCHPLVLR